MDETAAPDLEPGDKTGSSLPAPSAALPALVGLPATGTVVFVVLALTVQRRPLPLAVAVVPVLFSVSMAFLLTLKRAHSPATALKLACASGLVTVAWIAVLVAVAAAVDQLT